MEWPNDADGMVLSGLKAGGFNFEQRHDIDFNIDFDTWPLPDPVKKEILERYPNATFHEPDEEDLENGVTSGYATFSVSEKLTYDFVILTQQAVTREMEKYGGRCESWGVMH